MMVHDMKSIAVFEVEEYEKMMASLGLLDNEPDEDDDTEDYFNAWHFGQSEKDSEFVLCSSLQ